MRWVSKPLAALAALQFLLLTPGVMAPACAADLPRGFMQTQVGGPWSEAVGIAFAEDGTPFVWERGGRVRMQRNGQWHLVIDIHDEVGAWSDHGMLGFALDPNFLANGRVYLMYVVDHHHLVQFGQPGYNPNVDEYHRATIGRITRYTLDPNNNFQTIVPGSRTILLGETKSTGIPILFESHGVGSLVFGTDGTLLASCGDAAHFSLIDTGGPSTFALQALGENILKPKEDVGAFRAQLIDTLSAKILRLDPETGDGVPSNPFYDPQQPRAARSRVWALGVRNPCRMSLRPGTGSHNPDDANPGTLYFGDVGWDTWEELNVCTAPAQNFGWPIYEGLQQHDGYAAQTLENPDAPNPLDPQPGCSDEFFAFTELLAQETLGVPSFPNPCNPLVQIPPDTPTFMHRRPVLDWGRPNGPARTGIFVGDNAAVINVGAPGSPVAGAQFGGNCAIGGAWYTGTSYPRQYRNTYFVADYGLQWIKSVVFDDNDRPVLVQPFIEDAGEIVAIAAHPITGDLYYVAWNSVWHVEYAPGGNHPPVAIATANVTYGPSPLNVQFSSGASSDPDRDDLTYAWDFGDGSPISTQANPSHVFTAPNANPAQFVVTLTVTDAGGLTSQDSIVISVNNSPPIVTIVSPATGSTYSMAGNTTYALVAIVTDAEHGPGELTCEWQTALHHNNHTHEDPPSSDCVTSATFSPVGCDGNLYFYRVSLMVTDAAGLSGFDFVDIYPDCTGSQAPSANGDVAQAPRGGSTIISVLANDTDADGTLQPSTVAVVELPQHGVTSVNPATGDITYTHDGSAGESDQFGYTVNDNAGRTSNIASVFITILPAADGDLNGDGALNELDRAMLCAALGSLVGQPTYVPAADLNVDGAINQIDQQLFSELLPPCTGDIVTTTTFAPPADGFIDASDLAFLLGAWGNQPSCADFVTSATFAPPPDGKVDSADLAALLGAWGFCP